MESRFNLFAQLYTINKYINKVFFHSFFCYDVTLKSCEIANANHDHCELVTGNSTNKVQTQSQRVVIEVSESDIEL